MPWLLAGLSNRVFNALFATPVQATAPESVQGRVFGLITAMFSLANPLGALAAGVFLHGLPLYWERALTAVTDLALGLVLMRIPGRFEDPLR